MTLVGSPKKPGPDDGAKSDRKSPTKDNDAATAIMKDESIEMVDQSDEDIKYKEEEQEKNKYKTDDKFKLSQRFSEVESSAGAVKSCDNILLLLFLLYNICIGNGAGKACKNHACFSLKGYRFKVNESIISISKCLLISNLVIMSVCWPTMLRT